MSKNFRRSAVALVLATTMLLSSQGVFTAFAVGENETSTAVDVLALEPSQITEGTDVADESGDISETETPEVTEPCDKTEGCTLSKDHEGECQVTPVDPPVENENGEGETQPCDKTEGCTLPNGHEGECVTEPVTPPEEENGEAETYPCEKTEGCTFPNGHEGECVVEENTEDTEDTQEPSEEDIAAAVQAVVDRINSLPTTDDLANYTPTIELKPEDEGYQEAYQAALDAYYSQIKKDVEAARSAYDALTEEQKVAFDATVLAKLTALEELIAMREQANMLPVTEDKTLTVSKSGEYSDIQSAINHIVEYQSTNPDDNSNWTISVESGTWNRFLIPHGVSNITIEGQGNSTIVETLNGSTLNLPSADLHNSDGQGIIIWGANITLKNIKIVSENQTNGIWYASAVGTQDGMWGSSDEINSPITLDNCTFSGAGTGFAIMMQRSSFSIKNCNIENYTEAFYVAGDNFSADNCNITGNTIRNCTFAIHGYYGGNQALNNFVISNNHISGNSSRFSVIAILDQSNTGAVNLDISENTFSYTIVGGINQPTGTMGTVMNNNTMNEHSFVADAYWYSSSDYGTTFYAPKQEGKIATWYADPTSEEGQADYEQIKEALEEYGTAGQVIEINAPAQEIFTLAKNAIVIDDYVDAGSLKIEKNVESSTQDPTTFNFTITFTRENGLPLNGYYELINADGNLQTVKLEEGKLSFSLKDGESIIVKDLLPGTHYNVEEEKNDNYTTSSNNAQGDIVANETIVSSFINTSIENPPTPDPTPTPDPDPTPDRPSRPNRDDDDDWEPLPDAPVKDKPEKVEVETEVPEETETPAPEQPEKHNPETGDTTTAFAAMALAAVSLGGVVLLGRKKK